MKKKQEEIIKTHVLNLDEIRQAELKDKNKSNKKWGLFLAIFGILFITSGLVYPIIIHKFEKKPEIKPIKKEKNKIICINNFNSDTLKVKISSERTYNFSNNKLTSSTSKVTFTKTTNESNYLIALYQKYNQLLGITPNQAVVYSITYKEDKLIVKETIENYNKIEPTIYDNTLNIDSKSKLFLPTSSYDDIKKQSEQLGSLCN